MFENFTKSALESLVLAQAIASLQNHKEANSEQLLFSMGTLDESQTKDLLAAAGLTREKIYAAIQNSAQNLSFDDIERRLIHSDMAFIEELPLHQSITAIIEFASKLATQSARTCITNEHLLLALLETDKGTASAWLSAEGIGEMKESLRQCLNASKTVSHSS